MTSRSRCLIPILLTMAATAHGVSPDQEYRFTVDVEATLDNRLLVEAAGVREAILIEEGSVITEAARRRIALRSETDGSVTVTMAEDFSVAKATAALIATTTLGNDYNVTPTDRGPNIAFTDTVQTRIVDEVMATVEAAMGARLTSFGIKNADVRRYGHADIAVYLPALKDSGQVEALLLSSGRLRFVLLTEGDVLGPLEQSLEDYRRAYPDRDHTVAFKRDNHFSTTLGFAHAETKAELVAFVNWMYGHRSGWLGSEHEIIYVEEPEGSAAGAGPNGWRTIAVERLTIVDGAPLQLTGKSIRDATVTSDDLGDPYVAVDFDGPGAVAFEKLTRAGTGRFLAIVLDDEAMSVPIIEEPITGGRARISMGRGTAIQVQADASQLANVLQLGVYSAAVRLSDRREVYSALFEGHGAGSIITTTVTGGADLKSVEEALRGYFETRAGTTELDVRVKEPQPGVFVAFVDQTVVMTGKEAADAEIALGRAAPGARVGRATGTSMLFVALKEAAKVLETGARLQQVLAAAGFSHTRVSSDAARQLDLLFERTLAAERTSGGTPEQLDAMRVQHEAGREQALSAKSDRFFTVELLASEALAEHMKEVLSAKSVDVTVVAVGPTRPVATEAPAEAPAPFPIWAWGAVFGALILAAAAFKLARSRR